MNAKLLVGATLRAAVERLDAHFPRLGFRFKRDFGAPDMGFSLRLLRNAGFRPRCAIDVGAFQGEWALLCREVFGDVRVLMVEPAEPRHAGLRELCSAHPALGFVGTFLAASPGTVHFREQLTNSGAVPEAAPDTVAMPTTTLDALLLDGSFARPELVKIDTQGHDLEVLKGACRTLEQVEVVVTEMSLIPLAPSAPSVREFVDWLDDAGFRLFDICGFMRRPVDDALWQIDAVFVRKESSLGRTSLGW